MWNVVHTRPNHEVQVAKFLGLHGIQVFAPQFPAAARTRPGSVRDRRQRWVFPGYLFFKVPAAFDQWNVVHWAPGVHRVLSQEGAPSIVAEAVVDRIKARLAEPMRPTRFVAGQRVVIDRGPLTMVDAIFDRELNTSERVQVLVHLLGRPMAVAIDAAMLRPAS